MGLECGIWHVSREYGGIAEAGGLKDVVAGLAAAQVRRGIPAAAVLLRYGFLDLKSLEAEALPIGFRLELPSGNEASRPNVEEVGVYRLRRDGVDIFLLESERTRVKRGIYTYTGEDERENQYQKKGTGHWDAHHLNLTLQRGALELARRSKALGWRKAPAIFHCHDGHSSFLPALLRIGWRYRWALASSQAVITVHNAGRGYHQEIHDLAFARQLTGLPAPVLRRGLLNDAVDPLLLGPRYARVNTVSERYAQEIASGELEELTGGLGRAYREAGVELTGITNGIDPTPFDPRDPKASGLAFAFDPGRAELEGKRGCRLQMIKEIARGVPDLVPRRVFPGRSQLPGARLFSAESILDGLRGFGSLKDSADLPLFTFVGRLTGQKGVDVLAGALGRLLSRRSPALFLVLGQGEKALEEQLIELARSRSASGRFCLLIGYNAMAARYCYAAGDFFLVPSQYEPCGLTDLYAQMMGNLPVVHRVGGLVKVRHGETGYSYAQHAAEALCGAILEAVRDHQEHPERLERMRRQAFHEVFERYTWDRVLEGRYLALYLDVLGGR